MGINLIKRIPLFLSNAFPKHGKLQFLKVSLIALYVSEEKEKRANMRGTAVGSAPGWVVMGSD